jgi:DNA ligase (NAD+)
VIPKVVRVLTSFRDENVVEAIKKPENCPSCGAKLFEDGAALKCQNLDCQSRLANSLIHFASKRAMNIEGLGKEIIYQLYNAGKIRTVEDIYALNVSSFDGLAGFKDRRIALILEAIESSKKSELWRFIHALGIERVGEATAKKLARLFGGEWDQKTQAEYAAIDGFGEETSASIALFLRLNRERIDALKAVIEPIAPEKSQAKASRFGAKTVVITGSFSAPRETIKAKLEERGASVTASVTKKTDFLFAGESAGSKLQKAEELNVTVLSWEDFSEELEL